jgi:hypothetical protein
VSLRSKIIGGALVAVLLVLLVLLVNPAGGILQQTVNPTADRGRSANTPESSAP